MSAFEFGKWRSLDTSATHLSCTYKEVRRRGLRLSTRPGVGGVRSRIGIQQSLLSQSTRTATFQQRFDARQKIGLSDARLKLGVKDAREKLLQKDARFRIKGKVQDAREMLNSRKQQSTVPPKPRQVADARETISLKRRSPAAFTSPPVGTVTPALKLTKTIQVPQQKPMVPLHAHPAGMRINVVNNHQAKQNLYDLDEEDDVLAPIPAKQMKFSASGSFLPHTAGLSTSKLSMSKALPLTKVVQNDAYTAPALPSIRTKALTSMSRTLVNKEEAPKELPSAEAVLSPLEGTKMTVNNLHPRVTEEDIVELFCVCGALKRARLVHPGVAEVVFVKKDDAITAYKKYNNRCLDGQPMKCNLHMNGHVITSEQPILLRLSDSPAVKKESELPRRVAPAAAASPAAEVDPDTILKALFKSSGASVTTQPTEFKIKL
ncbi:polymerase delta-interacting protein 3 isoform X1 [Perognathus longimembris pacificus]|uniref:polymerase delta-interacting protein 3 isoform X1 n=1 Tax=Perognathus longimembris pacificus TaxID=214514 RepID=UPI002019B803|nr:polymerase delta-interacting protein 3 isoform X1 [Perognathus longimembris pacificus]XP_048210298.1 polymerase delta-interacting protein 3 isoform X1 [Perognathus longimembris pacificus]